MRPLDGLEEIILEIFQIGEERPLNIFDYHQLANKWNDEIQRIQDTYEIISKESLRIQRGKSKEKLK